MTDRQSKIMVVPNAQKKTDSRPCTFQSQVASEPIQMEIVFGRPSKDCADIGICRINLISDLPTSSKEGCDCKDTAKAWVQQNRNGQLVFRFPKNQINPNIFNTQFANNYFTVIEDYIFPELLQDLFYPRIEIKHGHYPITEEKDCLVIKL